MALTGQQAQISRLLYNMAVQHGATPQHAKEFVAAAYAESTLNPSAVNRSSGASGLFQLLSSGYRQKAQQLGGVQNPRANALAILPDYQRYWQQHPNAAPGEAAAAVERSGQGASFYARPLGQLGGQQFGGGPVTSPNTGVRPLPGFATAPDLTGSEQSLMSLATQAHPDYQPLFQQLQAAQQTPAQASPRLPQQSFSRPGKGLAGGFLQAGAVYKAGRADQGRDFQTNPGGPIIAPGAGYVVRVGSNPNGFGPNYPIVHFTSGPYAGQTLYIGHTHSSLMAGQRFTIGQVISRTGTTPVGNATVPGWAEIGFASGGSPGRFGQQIPFG